MIPNKNARAAKVAIVGIHNLCVYRVLSVKNETQELQALGALDVFASVASFALGNETQEPQGSQALGALGVFASVAPIALRS